MVKRKIKAIILVAGKGKRMESDLQKVFHSISGMPMFLFVINALKKSGVKDIILVGSEKKKFEKYLSEDICITEQKEPLGTGHAVLSAKEYFSNFDGILLIACGDMPLIRPETIRKLIKTYTKENASAAVLTARLNDPRGYGRILRDKNGNVSGIYEDTDIKKAKGFVNEVNSGMYCFNAKELRKILPLLGKGNKQKEYYLTDVIGLLVKTGKKVISVAANDPEEIMGINTRSDLSEAGSIINRRVINHHMQNGVTVVDPATTYIDTRVKIGRDTIIHPLTVIDGEVKIGKKCVVGPYAHLRDKTVLKDTAEIGNFVEVKKTKVGKHTKSKHLTYLGDAQIGDNVNIGAGTVIANYDGRNKHRTAIKNGAFIGSHSTLVAPVTVGKEAVTGAGCVVLRGRNVPDNTIVVGVPAKVLRKVNC